MTQGKPGFWIISSSCFASACALMFSAGLLLKLGEVCVALGEGKCPPGVQRVERIAAQCW